jgi:hypothetical protein
MTYTLCGELRLDGQLELLHLVPLQAVIASDALHQNDAEANLFRHRRGGPMGALTRRSGQGQRYYTFDDLWRQWRDGRGARLVAQQPSTPACMQRSWPRKTAVLAAQVGRVISSVPRAAGVSRTILARQSCICGVFRSAITASRLARSAALTSMTMSLRAP